MKDNKNYYLWLDFAKVIGIYLVVIGHGNFLNAPGKQVVYACHMPLFFFISGILWHYRTPLETIRKSGKSLLLPYIIINIICMIYTLWYMIKVGAYHDSTFIDVGGAIIMGLGYSVDNWIPASPPTWFLVVLFLIHLLMSFDRRRLFQMVIFFFSLIICYVFNTLQYDAYIPVDTMMMAIPFFLIGIWGKHLLFMMYKKIGTIEKCMAFLLLFVVFLLLNNYNGRVDMAICKYGNSMIVFWLTEIIGTIMILIASIIVEALYLKYCKRISMGGVLLTAQGTVMILGFNLIVISYVVEIVKLLIPLYYGTNITGMFIGLIILICFIPPIFIAKKYFPAIIGYR